MDIKLLQIGFPKSGNYWLYNIIQQIYGLGSIPHQSYISKQPVYNEAKEWDLSNSRQAGIDMMDIERGKCFYRISSAVREPITDFNKYLAETNHVWTHSEVCENITEVLQQFNRLVYIYRDPRDMAVSAARYAFTPYMKKYHPPKEDSVEKWLENNLAETIQNWIWHITDYLLLKDKLDIHFMAYENLLESFSETVMRLSSYVGVELNAENINGIEQQVSFKNMKKKDPGHVKKGKRFQWTEMLDQQQQKMIQDMAGELLALLNYPPEPSNDLPENMNLVHINDIEKVKKVLLSK